MRSKISNVEIRVPNLGKLLIGGRDGGIWQGLLEVALHFPIFHADFEYTVEAISWSFTS